MTNFSGDPISSQPANAARGGPQGGGMDSRRNGVAEVSSTYLAEMASNTIPVGYKQTEVGIIPKDWQLSNIRTISAVPMQNGLFYEPKRKGKGVPLINVGDMYTSAPVDVDSLELFEANASEIKVFRVARGDLFFTRSSVVPSGIAYCNIFDAEREDVVFDSHLIRVRPNTELIDPRYLYLNCIAKHARAALIAEAKTATMTTIDQGAINRCPVLVPPKQEQTAIANALSDVDALISELEKLIAKKQAIKTATMQQLLTGRTSLPQFALREDGTLKGTKPSELGEIPEDWECRLIPEIAVKGPASIKIGPFGSALKKEYLLKTGYKVYGQENVYEKDMSVGNRYISYAHYLQLKSCSIQGGDFLISMMGTVGKCFVVPPEVEQGIMDSHLLRLRLDASKVDSNLMVQFFQTRIILDQITQLSVGGIMEGLSSKIIKSIFIPLPVRIEEQTAIATILSDMDAEVQALEQRLGKTRQIKQGMMQELLKGKTRLVQGVTND